MSQSEAFTGPRLRAAKTTLAILVAVNVMSQLDRQIMNVLLPKVQPDLMHLAFEVDDLKAFTANLEQKGFKLSDGPTPTSSGSMIAFIDAPEGYEVELIQRAK